MQFTNSTELSSARGGGMEGAAALISRSRWSVEIARFAGIASEWMDVS